VRKLAAAVAGNPEHGSDPRKGKLGSNGHGSPDPSAQRERLIEAFTKVAAERGYDSVTAAEVTAAAGVPTEAFHSHFENNRQCLGAAYDAFFERLVFETQESIDSDQDWPLQDREAVAAGLEFDTETATRARFFAVEALDAGPLMLERYVNAIERAVPLLHAGRDHCPAAASLPAVTEPVLIGGVACMVGGALLQEEQAGLPAMESELVEILLTPYLGAEEARRFAA
jgi:AcrR family transcriptional regulator